jgi:hypothetical protein
MPPRAVLTTKAPLFRRASWGVADHAGGLGVPGAVDGDDVGARQAGGQRDRLATGFKDAGGVDIRVTDQHFHFQRAAVSGDAAADAAEAHHQQRAFIEFDRQHGKVLAPASLAYHRVELGIATHQLEHQRQRVLGNADRVGGAVGHQHDTFLRAARHIDEVVTDPDPADHLHCVGNHQLGGAELLAIQRDAVRAGQQGVVRLVRQVGIVGDRLDIRTVLQQGPAGRRNALGDQHALTVGHIVVSSNSGSGWQAAAGNARLLDDVDPASVVARLAGGEAHEPTAARVDAADRLADGEAGHPTGWIATTGMLSSRKLLTWPSDVQETQTIARGMPLPAFRQRDSGRGR